MQHVVRVGYDRLKLNDMIIFTMILISVVAFQSLKRSGRDNLLLYAGAHRHLSLREFLSIPSPILVDAELLCASTPVF